VLGVEERHVLLGVLVAETTVEDDDLDLAVVLHAEGVVGRLGAARVGVGGGSTVAGASGEQARSRRGDQAGHRGTLENGPPRKS
jgi:hypothetical protein